MRRQPPTTVQEKPAEASNNGFSAANTFVAQFILSQIILARNFFPATTARAGVRAAAAAALGDRDTAFDNHSIERGLDPLGQGAVQRSVIHRDMQIGENGPARLYARDPVKRQV